MPLDDRRRRLPLAPARLACLLAALVIAACGEQRPATDEPAGEAPRADSTPAAADQEAPTAPATLAGGEALYERHCAACHGATGRGDGPMSRVLSPPPRGFVNEPWRYFSADTPEEVRAGITRIIDEGVPSTGMPAFGEQISDSEIQAIVDHVLHLRAAGESG